MSHKKKLLVISVCVLVGINIIGLDILLVWGKVDMRNIVFSNIIKLLQVIIPTLNLIFVISVWFVGHIEKTKTYELSIRKHWYHNVLIKDNLKVVSNLFETSIKIVGDIAKIDDDYNKLRPIYREVKDRRNEVINNFCVILQAIDDSFASIFSKKVRDYEDFITIEGNKYAGKEITEEEFIRLIKQEEASFYKMLFNYDLKQTFKIEKSSLG